LTFDAVIFNLWFFASGELVAAWLAQLYKIGQLQGGKIYRFTTNQSIYHFSSKVPIADIEIRMHIWRLDL